MTLLFLVLLFLLFFTKPPLNLAGSLNNCCLLQCVVFIGFPGWVPGSQKPAPGTPVVTRATLQRRNKHPFKNSLGAEDASSWGRGWKAFFVCISLCEEQGI